MLPFGLFRQTMHSPVVSSSTLIMLRELLAVEKENTRSSLRVEMNRIVEPMVDSIFNKINTKLANAFERNQSGDGQDREQLLNHNYQLKPAHEQMHQSEVSISQPSTSFISNFSPAISPTNFNSNQQSQMRHFVQPTTNAQVNFEQLSNEPTNLVHCPPTLSQTVENGQSTNNHLNDQNFDGENTEEDDDDGICECDDCVNGIENEEKEIGDDDSDSVQWIEDVVDEQELARIIPRIDSTQQNKVQPEVVRQPIRLTAVEAQPTRMPNGQNKHSIAVSLQCPQPNCPNTFTTNEHNQAVNLLKDHLKNVHSISPHRCFVKNCKQSFDNPYVLIHHIRETHRGISQWHCDKCSSHYSTYQSLSQHNIHLHQLGHFRCSFPFCTFTGKCSEKVRNHYRCHSKGKPNNP